MLQCIKLNPLKKCNIRMTVTNVVQMNADVCHLRKHIA